MARVFAVSAILAVLAMPAWAADWSVARSSGDVAIVRDGVQHISLQNAGTIRPGDKVMTGGNGRLMLVRGEETVTIAPNTVLIVPEQPSHGKRTTLLQSVGKVVFEVEKRNVQHFEVETPFLAAVVKGTKFTVDVGASGSSVSVERGAVEVFDFDTGEFAMVRPGERAFTVNKPGRGLSLSGGQGPKAIERRAPRKSLLDPGNRGSREASAPKAKAKLVKTTAGLRLDAPIGAVKLDVAAATKGLIVAPGAASAHASSTRNSNGHSVNLNVGSAGQGSSNGLSLGAGQSSGGLALNVAGAGAGGGGLALGVGHSGGGLALGVGHSGGGLALGVGGAGGGGLELGVGGAGGGFELGVGGGGGGGLFGILKKKKKH